MSLTFEEHAYRIEEAVRLFNQAVERARLDGKVDVQIKIDNSILIVEQINLNGKPWWQTEPSP